jgi:predicted anti-sigma-YlaC factor YlaD
MTLASITKDFSPTAYFIALGFVFLLESGCGTLRQAALGDIAGIFLGPSGSDVFVEDDDPELIREALPFVLKSYEALLASNPKDRDLLLATAGGFVRYANAFVHAEADRSEGLDFRRARHLRRRATKLYRRGRTYALAGLALDWPDFEEKLRKDPRQVLQELSKRQVPLLFWAAAGWAGAISTDVNNMSLVAELPIVEAMMRRALQLDEDFDRGAIHEFFITYEGGRTDAMGGSAKRALGHFHRAVEITQGKKALPYVLLASSVAVRKQDYKMFKDLLHKALAIDPDAVPELRLVNTLAQEKARWLLDHRADLFVDFEETQP